jgi:hypothetical protein
MKRTAVLLFAALLIFVLALSAAPTVERYLALALPPGSLGNNSSTAQIQTTIGIEHPTPENQIEELSAIARKGSDALYKALADQKQTGWISVTGRPTAAATFLISHETPAGREIVMITPHPIYFFEPRNPDRSRDYRFGVVRLTLDKAGNGSGTVTAAAIIKSITPTTVVIDDYGTIPTKLTGVHLQN